MLITKNLTAGYKGIEVIKDINFKIEPGEIVAIIGPNGAGKSTFLKSIFNLAEVYSGRIYFKDKDITDFETHELIYYGISYVPQGRLVFSNMTVLENLEMGAFIFNDKDLIKNNLEHVYREFPVLKRKKDELAGNLSGGEQQMLAIARALMQSTELLLLDEPSLGLAPKVVSEIFEKILKLKSEGISIIIVEQNAKKAVEIADRTYIFEDGKIALEGGKEILKDPRIKEIYFGGR
jgi:branched-chain amino acid transport system ATP-binding protein